MSRRAYIDKTPITHRDSFSAVSHDEVRAGDVYQGKKNPRKWYANTEGQNCVDRDRQYYRPGTPISSAQLGPVIPNKHGHVRHDVASDTEKQHAPGQPCASGGPLEEHDQVKKGIEVGEIEHLDGDLVRISLRMTMEAESFNRMIADSIRDAFDES